MTGGMSSGVWNFGTEASGSVPPGTSASATLVPPGSRAYSTNPTPAAPAAAMKARRLIGRPAPASLRISVTAPTPSAFDTGVSTPLPRGMLSVPRIHTRMQGPVVQPAAPAGGVILRRGAAPVLTRATTLVAVTERAPLSRNSPPSPSRRRSRSTRRRRPCRPPGGPSSPTPPASRTSRPRSSSWTPPPRPARPRELPLHARRGASGAARGDRREDAARLRARGGPIAGRRDERRQAGGLSGLPGGREPRRRGAPPRAVLDDVSRGDRAG